MLEFSETIHLPAFREGEEDSLPSNILDTSLEFDPDKCARRMAANTVLYCHTLYPARGAAVREHKKDPEFSKWGDIQSLVTKSTNPDYLHELARFDHIQNITLTLSMDEAVYISLKKYYPAASNDCEALMFEDHNNYNSSLERACVNDLREAFTVWEPLHRQYEALAAGWPRGSDVINMDEQRPLSLSYVHVLPTATAFSDGTIISRGTGIVPHKCCSDTCTSNDTGKEELQDLHVYRTVITASQISLDSSTFKMEHLSRLVPYMDYFNKEPDSVVHVDKEALPFLELLGIKKNRAVVGDIRAETLIVPMSAPCGEYPIFASQFLSFNVRARSEPSNRDRVIYVGSQDTNKWTVQDEDIFRMLKQLGEAHQINVSIFGLNPKTRMTDVQKIFSEAFMVVATHSTTEESLFFVPPGTVIVEGLCRQGSIRSRSRRALAKVLGLRYFGLISEKECSDLAGGDLKEPVNEILKLREILF